jgi:cytochrome c oxidase assembly factor CtaG
MGALIEILLFALPFLAYLVWWRMAGRKPGHEPSSRLIVLAAAGVLCGLAGAIWYGLSRSSSGDNYEPARLEGGRILRGTLR